MPEILKVKPTRMELLKLKRRVKLAERGHKLLKEKQDALIMEFFTIYDEALSMRRELIKKIGEAFEALRLAQVEVGSVRLKEIAIGVNPNKEIEVRSRNIMGVRVPLIEVPELKRKPSERGYAFISTSSAVDVAAEKFEEVLELAIRLAEVEESLKRLGKEIEKTKRRVNALEYIIIPRMKNTIKFIEQHLDEMERENFFRLKRIKALLEARESM
ncbi:V-type ATP synthase subunit D [Pyrococcus furiosus DSM 3638]|uniref:A-type ATP synthase subunit D n=3 Tax=Pyrococcus furiosus TaxID=2261 RepID=AATD_PYRFU|nr:V-type ATP synthase subunit D [Pyrococcus furiosus]Q8U4A4.1 RecName: Full=V-type ATP synthase subunit D; AltName: Full=V-ATPase subunit D [Pyrococcus furiosus DSM 3638]AAL80308.1 ATPase subunit D [Pyrococcus furiosus DSM 3638]AFN04392.1 V-type ATP synthase subunit D [Pyrococcus furiosus COM1]QEK77910.1 V-type ATP synthase subunit D [Pyrococcus furiosus DSM 3638]